MKTISIAMCTYNGEKYIEKQLRSIIDQTVKPDEIIICDDCSNDTTVDIIRNIAEHTEVNITIIENKCNLGVTKNFEKCLSFCRGDIIFLSDQDDVWMPEKISKCLHIFNCYDCILMFTDAEIINGDDDLVFPSLNKKDMFMQGDDSYKKYCDEIIRLNHWVYGCTMAFKKEAIESITPFPISHGNHDGWILCCASMRGKVFYLYEPLIQYRIHQNNVIGSLIGTSAYDEMIKKQDDYDRFFNIQDMRDTKVILLKKSVTLSNVESDSLFYLDSLKLIKYYETIKNTKNQSPLQRCLSFLKILFSGCYKYRFCDRGVSVTLSHLFKQFIVDSLFLLHDSK